MREINKRYIIDSHLKSTYYYDVYLVKDQRKNITIELVLLKAELSVNSLIETIIQKHQFYTSFKHRFFTSVIDFDVVEQIDDSLRYNIQYFYTREPYLSIQNVDYHKLSKEKIITLLIDLIYAVKYFHHTGRIFEYLNFDNIAINEFEGNYQIRIIDLISLEIKKNLLFEQDEINAQFTPPEVIYENESSVYSDYYSLGKMLFYLFYQIDYKKINFRTEISKFGANDLILLLKNMTSTIVSDRTEDFEKVFSKLLEMNVASNSNRKFNSSDYVNYTPEFNDKNLNLSTMKSKIVARYNYENKYNGFAIFADQGMGKTRFIDELYTYFHLKKINALKISLEEFNDNPLFLVQELIHGLKLNDAANRYDFDKLGINIDESIIRFKNKFEDELESEYLKVNNRLMNYIIDKIKYKPIVVLIDNVEYLEKREIKMLNYYLNANQIYPITYVFSMSKDFAKETFDFDLLSRKVDYVELFGLDYLETNNLLKSILGMNENPNNLIGLVMNETNGNPMKIIEMIKARITSGKLYISEDFEWFMNSEKGITSVSGEVDTQSIQQELDALNENEKEILRMMSLFDFSIEADYLIELIDIDRDLIAKMLKNLKNKDVISEKIGDNGYVYELKNQMIKVVLKNQIEGNKYIELNIKAAEVIRKNTSPDNYQFNKYLIHHYRESKQYEKAIALCLRVADEIGKEKNIAQQIMYYEIVVQINTERNLEVENILVYRRLAEIYLDSGKNNQAYELIEKSISIALMMKNMSAYVDSLYIKLLILFNFNKISEAEEIVSEVLKKINKNVIKEGYFKICYIKSKILQIKNKIDAMLEFNIKMLEEAKKENFKEYIARFYNELGIAYFQNGESDQAISYYQKSYDCFIEIGDYLEASRPINNIGVVYTEIYGDYTKGREYFYKGLKAVENQSDASKKILYLFNIGDSYLYEDEYENALKYLLQAEKLAHTSHNSNWGFSILVSLFNVYTLIEQYDTAFSYLNRIENELMQSNDRGVELQKYYFAAIDYFIHVNDFINAEKYFGIINRELKETSKNDELLLKIIRHQIIVFKSQLFERNFTADINFIKALDGVELKKREIRVFRKFILQVVNSLFYTNKIIEITYLLNLDQKLSEKYDTEVMRLKRKIVSGILESDRITYYKNLMGELKYPSDKWVTYDLLGREYYYEEKYFSSFNYLFKALDEIKKAFMTVPFEFREKFIFYDSKKIEIRNFIVNIMAKLIGRNLLNDELIFTEYEIGEVSKFFELKHYDEIINHQRIKDSSDLNLESNEYFSSITDLINAFEYNDHNNIHLILKYLKQYTFCDYVAIYIYDSNNKLSEVMEEGVNEKYDIDTILRNFYGSEGIIINDFLRIGNSNYLKSNQNALMLIPLKSDHLAGFNRRTIKSNKTSYSSYLYLSSSSPFNNFTLKTYEEILKLNRFIYQYIEKYFLNNFFTIDKTTGVFMRSHVEECIHQEIYYSKLTEKKFSIAMCDIDRFKDINDTFGHKKGDDVLKTIGDIFKESLRDTDIVGRYGGEEFIVLLPNTDENDSLEVVERIRTSIEEFNFTGLNRKITMSFGIASYPAHSETLEELIEKADQALYISKALGRNLVTLWNSRNVERHNRFNDLAGIRLGTEAINNRNINGIVKLINMLRTSNDNLEKQKMMIEIMMQLIGAKYCTYVDQQNNYLSKKINEDEFIDNNLFDEFLIDNYMENDEGDYFVDWRNFTELNPDTEKMSWRSIIAIPIDVGKMRKGLLLFGVPVYEKEFEFSDYNLIFNIVPLLGTII